MGYPENVWKVRRALEEAGITFIDEDEVDGAGSDYAFSGSDRIAARIWAPDKSHRALRNGLAPGDLMGRSC